MSLATSLSPFAAFVLTIPGGHKRGVNRQVRCLNDGLNLSGQLSHFRCLLMPSSGLLLLLFSLQGVELGAQLAELATPDILTYYPAVYFLRPRVVAALFPPHGYVTSKGLPRFLRPAQGPDLAA
jgi:hypothetical protein